MEAFGKFMAWIVLFIASNIVRALSVTLAYNWLIVTIYHIPSITYIQGFAISAFAVLLKGTQMPSKKEEAERKWYESFVYSLIYNGFAILFSWFIYLGL